MPMLEDGNHKEEDEEGREEVGETSNKRKRDEGSDATMGPWRLLIQCFLDQLLRHEGLGNGLKCSCCATVFPRTARRFCCTECGVFVQCMACALERHQLSPFHRVAEWKGSYWARISLQKIGSVYQLGHGGHPCPRPVPVAHTMVVMDMSGMHTVCYRFCGCDESDRTGPLEQFLHNGWYPATTVDPATCVSFAALDLYRLLNVVGNINVHDFVGALERITDACGIKKVPDRCKAFGVMARQYGFLKRLMRTGLGNTSAGLAGTENGACAVLCWTCPHNSINILEGWREVSPEFLYMLILAMDTNFRLKNRLWANERLDLLLGDGWGHLVQEPPYKEHLKGYVAEKDVSTCIAFAALMQKDTWLTTGMQCSGVGGIVCARHKLMHPEGMGDLQKGKRYVNMDYILFASIVGLTAMYLTVSYDITCQWQVNLPMRLAALPERLRLDLVTVTLLFGLPVWHAAAHERSCQVQNSLSYQQGMARTDGEGIERTWSGLNPLGWPTKEMGAGARHNALEDKIDHHNFEKNIGQGTALPRKLILAIKERDRQVAAFTQVDTTLSMKLRETWQKKIDEWLEDRTKPNPYEAEVGKEGGPTKALIRMALTVEEAREAGTGDGSFRAPLEDTQQRIRREVKGRPLLAADHNEKIAEMRIAFFTKLRKFRKLQVIYMPAAVERVEAAEDTRDPELPAPRAEDMTLYLPSELGLEERADGCRKTLPEMEGKLRKGQAATRAYMLVERIGESVDKAAAKYVRGWAALIALRGDEETEGWKELKPKDVQLDKERESDTKAWQKLGRIGSNRWRCNGPTLSSKKRSLSWIWMASGGPRENKQELHDSVRVEWSKAKARRDQWNEEVKLLREEMKCVLRFLRWRLLWWEARRIVRRDGIADGVTAGAEAYAARQATLLQDIARKFKTAWETSAATAVRMAVRKDVVLAESMAAFAEIADTEGVDNTI
ncbi:hypothetical protein B0H17DRAFT_1159285 [Mycena rosella]|uniref:CxC2-like cysteine cluster KDZ transposase-associated domain-containing protein n=1 Tax=Mycena rosella TaxID=1033263 RepID=A0AAD7GH02_MYCRO|nr:hypothetical protein B0H17DRAFT_1159285 [Mycena rosella]